MTKERVFFWQKWKVGSSWALGPRTGEESPLKELDIRRGGKNDSGREDKFSSEVGRGEGRVTKSFISCVSHSASSPSSPESSSTVAILGLGGRKCGIDLANKTDSLFEFGAVTDAGMCSSSEVFGVSGCWPTVSSLDDEEVALEMDEAKEWVRLRKRMGMTLVAGVRINETADSCSGGGEGKSKDLPAMRNLMSPDTERWGG